MTGDSIKQEVEQSVEGRVSNENVDTNTRSASSAGDEEAGMDNKQSFDNEKETPRDSIQEDVGPVGDSDDGKLDSVTSTTSNKVGIDRTNGRTAEDDSFPHIYSATEDVPLFRGGPSVTKEIRETPHSLLHVVRFWTERTSTHGVRYAFEPNFFGWKHVCWFILVTAMATITVLACVALVQQYLGFNTKTSTSSISPDSLPFPEVTVCNANPYQTSLQEQYNITWPRNEEEVNLISQPLEDFMLETKFNNFSYLASPVDDDDDSNKTVDLKHLWRPVITPRGRCWAFRTSQRVSVPGQNFGLSFMVNIQQQEYSPESITAGIAFYVSQPGTQIVDQMTPLTASPGGVAVVTFNSNNVTLETRKPWSSCTGVAPEYTQFLCREECFNRARAQACNCRPMGDVQPELRDLDYCSPLDNLCTQNETMLEDEDCSCRSPPCREVKIRPQSTRAQLSTRFQRLMESSLNVTENYLANNIVVVTLNYDTMIQHETEETRVQGPYELMAALGGVTSLYMGISLISIVEIFGELLLFRLLPRLWGDQRLFGIGGRS